MTNLLDPLLLLCALGATILFALIYFTYQSAMERKSRSSIKKRLQPVKYTKPVMTAENEAEKADKKVSSKVARKANDFYANTDPASIRKIQMMLIQAGYLNAGAVGYFLAARVLLGLLGLGVGFLLASAVLTSMALSSKLIVILVIGVAGYFAPNLYVKRRASVLANENRQGFPDVMDLMIVSAEAGLTMEGSIERIAQEIRSTFPNLSLQLNMAALEIRAGRPIDQALRAFGERLNLEEVQGFATMIQQSKELGTSISDALRVYSDEMRHKRMMRAEEKAYALPAKMSIPVTVFILPIVIGVAVIPTIVRFATG